MSAKPEPAPELIDFPDPRQAPPKRKEKISMPRQPVESVLKQISKGISNTPTNQDKPENNDDTPVDPDAGEEDEKEELRKQRREVARIQSESMERMRVARELEVLLNAREKVLDNREALLSADKTDHLTQSDLSALEGSLKEIRKVMDTANQSLTQMENLLSARRASLENASKGTGDEATAGKGKPLSGYSDITHDSLAEQVAFLQEREAYVEKSENILFEKAQQLQEWETRLEQMEHDNNRSDSQIEDISEKEA